ncbi:MAG: type I DNA topoisomerase [Candidatus Nomurabacteria bacterium]|nr:MAG: type I DNA topoisomerase [Candidatus Nomurabacteria bacterium]
MAKQLIIVESPTKAKTIARFLGKDYTIRSSNGHVRDLPKSTLGVDVDDDFSPSYVIPTKSKKQVAELKKLAKEADVIYFATDEDREGEAISWHLAQLLKPTKAELKRITFHEITKEAIEAALQNPRTIDENLVDAQQARRVLDRLVGYELSPLLWKKIAYGLSAGRVQSVAVDLIVQRELERMRFVSGAYWDLQARLQKDQQNFDAKLTALDGQRIANGKDFSEQTGKLKEKSDAILIDAKRAKELQGDLQDAEWKVSDVQEKPQQAHPAPPFITSSLQQEANRKLGLSSRDTMRIAQRLYEEGLITYMRTDSPNLSQQGIAGAREAVEQGFGKEFLSAAPRQYKAKSRGAQEAHEAIRPAGAHFRSPDAAGLSGREKDLYALIWKRTLATQMAEAKKLIMTVKIQAKQAEFTATGTTILFPGFLKVYADGAKADILQDTLLPKLSVGDIASLEELTPEEHTTKPPARFNDATLVKTLEQNGVGRPSTYASIISTIIDRNYVRRIGNALAPTFTAFAVTQLLTKHFAHLVDTNFTSKMEEELDQIAEGKLSWKPYIKNFYSGEEHFHQQVEEQEDKIDPNKSRSFTLPHLPNVEIRVGRYGPYIVSESGNGDDDTHASIPEDLAPADLSEEQVQELLEVQKNGPKPMGQYPETGEPIYVLTGRFGPYLQVGEKTDENPKPRRASIPRGVNPNELSMEDALKYLSLPRTLGAHPESGKDVVANVGRFGPYIVHDGDFRSLTKDDDVYTVSLARALELLAQEKKGRRGAKELKKLGEHPKDKKPVTLLEGRYGPYLKHGRTNASLPKDIKVEELTLEKAVEILAEKKKKK